jgi:hypothetical protein
LTPSRSSDVKLASYPCVKRGAASAPLTPSESTSKSAENKCAENCALWHKQNSLPAKIIHHLGA